MSNNEHLYTQLRELKKRAGSHSPSIPGLREAMPDLEITVDGCFLSNPYATDLFMDRMQQDLLATPQLFRDTLEFYPSQNNVLAEVIAPVVQAPAENIFIGNGAIEVIQAVLHRFTVSKVAVILPTFSSYYEFVRPDTEVVTFTLKKEDDFAFDVDAYIEFIREHKPDTIVLITPNNPTGTYITRAEIARILEEAEGVSTAIIDESFIHFAYEDEERTLLTNAGLVETHPEVVIVKSMSKDFGIAGIRAGYGIMSPDRVEQLLTNGHLWNSSGLAEYFFRLYANTEFQAAYEQARQNYLDVMGRFSTEMAALETVRTTPSQANFILAELLLPEADSQQAFASLLIENGIYIRSCHDKVGLEESAYLRVACRTPEENEAILAALNSLS